MSKADIIVLVIEKMWHHLPNGTCTKCNNSKPVRTPAVYKHIGNQLLCEKCIIALIIFNDATSEQIQSEYAAAKSENCEAPAP